jgi:dihydropteroate synthase
MTLRPGRHSFSRESLLIEPAHDFEKATRHPLEPTRLDEMAATGWPGLVSLSNQDFVGETLDLPTDQRVTGTRPPARTVRALA